MEDLWEEKEMERLNRLDAEYWADRQDAEYWKQRELKGIDEIGGLLAQVNALLVQMLRQQGSRPPALAEFLVVLCVGRGARPGRGKVLADTTLECLDETFERECKELGEKRARMRYWGDALHSSWPFVRAAFGRLVAGAGLLKVGAGIWKWWSGG
jgi:hypothetical protein